MSDVTLRAFAWEKDKQLLRVCSRKSTAVVFQSRWLRGERGGEEVFFFLNLLNVEKQAHFRLCAFKLPGCVKERLTAAFDSEAIAPVNLVLYLCFPVMFTQIEGSYSLGNSTSIFVYFIYFFETITFFK